MWSFVFREVDICFFFLGLLSDPVCIGRIRQTGGLFSCSATSSLILCTVYCAHSKLWWKKPVSNISHLGADKLHVFNMIFCWLRRWWVISHAINKFGLESTGSKEVDTLADLYDFVWSTTQRNTLPSRSLPAFVYALYVVRTAWQARWTRCLIHQSHHTTDTRQVQRHLSSRKFWALQHKPGSWNSTKTQRCLGNVTASRGKKKDKQKKKLLGAPTDLECVLL